MRFHIITLFPRIFDSYLGESILKRAIAKNLIRVFIQNIRDFTKDKSRSRSDRGFSTKQSGHRAADGRPYGGGAGMVLKALPILRAAELVRKNIKKGRRVKVALFSAKGNQFNQKTAYRWAKNYDDIILISGRYEGIDERARKVLKAEEISIGPYVLTDGEAAAMAVLSAVSRLVPGVIRLESLAEESHWNALVKEEQAPGQNLEYPHYTRPEVLVYKSRRYRVPKVLLSGDHKKIALWRKKHSS